MVKSDGGGDPRGEGNCRGLPGGRLKFKPLQCFYVQLHMLICAKRFLTRNGCKNALVKTTSERAGGENGEERRIEKWKEIKHKTDGANRDEREGGTKSE